MRLIAFIKPRLHVFSLTAIIAALLIVLPLLQIVYGLFTKASDAWIHIRTHLLSGYLINTMILIFFVALLSAMIGFFTAYVVTRFEFKGRRLLSWTLILPLAIPSYIAAYVYADMLSYTGTFSRFFRQIFNTSHGISIMHMPGAILLFSFTLYPYVYMLLKSALEKQSAAYEENARLLKARKLRVFWRVVLPLLRPALVAGTLLVVLETLNDYGVVEYLNIRVFSFAIFDAWFRLGDTTAAIRLSGVLMLVVFAIIFIERVIRGKRRYHMHVKNRPIERIHLQGFSRFVYPGILWVILALGFIIPVLQLLYYARLTFFDVMNISFVYLIINSISIALAATLIIVFIAVMLANFGRKNDHILKRGLLKVTNLGYAIPGAVIAIAVMLFFIDIDHRLYPIYRLLNPEAKRLLLTSSLWMLLFAYVLRFMAIGFNSIEAAYDKIGMTFTEASYSLKQSKVKTLLKVDLPLIKGGLITAAIIVFIDVIKELPLTLILRPTNYETLASSVYRYAREEMIQESAVPSLVIIMIASLLIYWLTHRKKKVVKHHVRTN